MAVIFTGGDPAFLFPQKGNPRGDPPATAKAAGVIGNITYVAAQAGAAGNSITVSHALSSPIAAVNASATLGNLTYTAVNSGTAGNSITVASTTGSTGSAGTATLTRALAAGGNATFSVSEKLGFYGNATTVKLACTNFPIPVSDFTQFTASTASDSNYNDVALLLNANSYRSYAPPNGGVNSAFIDSALYKSLSVNNSYLGANQGSFTPFTRESGAWSYYFDGASYLSYADGDSWTLSGDFTIEAWIKPFTTSGYQVVAAQWPTAGGNGFAFGLNANRLWLDFDVSGTTNTCTATSTTVKSGTWNHVAVSRSGSTIRLFVNGICDSSTYSVSGHTNSTGALTIGYKNATNNNYYKGSISNLHIVNGTALYNANFATPSSKTVATQNTKLLTCQDNKIKDNSVSNLTATVTGIVKAITSSPIGGSEQVPSTDAPGSVLLNAEGVSPYVLKPYNDPFSPNVYAYIRSTESTLIDLSNANRSISTSGTITYTQGTGVYFGAAGSALYLPAFYLLAAPFCIEMTITPEVPSAGSNIVSLLGGRTDYSKFSGIAPTLTYNSIAQNYTLNFYATFDGTTWGIGVTNIATIPVGSETRLAFTRSSNGYFVVYVNGTAYTLNASPNLNQLSESFVDSFTIGAGAASQTQAGSSRATWSYRGWMKEIRITTGTQRYLSGSYTAQTGIDSAVSGLNFGTGNFTIESWVYLNGDSAQSSDFSSNRVAMIFSNSNKYTIKEGFEFYINGSTSTTGTGIVFSNYVSGLTYSVSYTGAIAKNTWHHIAVSRSGTTTRIFLNGVLVQSGTLSNQNVNGFSYPIAIGSSAYINTGFLNGFMSNLRVVKGTAVYTAGFTPPTSALTAISGTSLLTLNSSGITDSSSNAISLAMNGDGIISPNNPFAATTSVALGSIYLNGSSLSRAATAELDFGTGNFTIESWCYVSSGSSTSGIFSKYTATPSANGYRLMMENAGTNGFSFKVFSSGSTVGSISYAGAIPKGTWNHFAVSRSGANIYLFLNGDLVATQSNWGSISVNGTGYAATVGDSSVFIGYLSGLRVIKGTALYTQSFTPAVAAPLPISNTKLLLNFANASVIDSTKGINAYALNTLQTGISTSISKFGGSSFYVAPSFTYIAVGEKTDPRLAIGTNDFTIETWLYLNSNSSGTIYSDIGTLSTRAGSYTFQISSGKLSFYANNGTVNLSSSSTISTGTWHHVAVSRSSGTLKLFLNGLIEATLATAAANVDLLPSTNYVSIGASLTNSGAGGYLDGYIDDLRVTIGTDRYPASGISRTLVGTTETISFPSGSTVAQVLAVVGNSGTNPSSRVAITSSSSGTLSATNPSPNNGVTTSGGVASQPLAITVNGNAISVRLAGDSSTTASILKSAIEANASASALVTVSNPVGSATAFASTALSGGVDPVAASLSVNVAGNNISLTVPADTPAATVVAAVNQDAGASALVTATASDGNSATTTGSVNLTGGIG